jgi:hypothetical protein
MRDFFNARDVTIAVSYHTYSELVLWSWGYAFEQTDDNALMTSIGQGIAARITKQSGSGTYTPQPGAALYPTMGASDDWIYGYRYYTLGRNTLAYTVEIGASFQPPESSLQQILDENWDGALYALQQAAGAAAQMTPFVLPPILSAPAFDPDGDFTVSWTQKNPDAGADTYNLQELTDLTVETDGAESGVGKWTVDQFSASTARAHSGSYSFRCALGNEGIASMKSRHPLPVDTGDTLTFWTWYDIEEDWDMAFVEVSVDGRKYDMLDKFTGTSGWTQKSYSLDAYAGREIYIRFRYTTDSYTTGAGFYVDDISPVAWWTNITQLSAAITDSYYDITGRAEGDYFYRVRGSSPSRGWGDWSDLGMVRVTMDCNGNSISDATDIAGGFSLDCNGNDVPDECEYPGCPGILAADMNCDGVLNGADVMRFVETIVADGYTCQADMPPQDGDVDMDDVTAFVNALLSP